MSFRDAAIGFPGLFGDWKFTADAKLLDFGNGIYWYGVLIALGLMLALVFCMRQAKHYGLTDELLTDLALWEIPLCVVGARIYYVLFNLSFYRDSDGALNWKRMVAFWDGGLAIYGAIIVGFLTAYVFCRSKKVPLAAVSDCAVMGLFIGQAIGRWGNFMNREAFGVETTLPWRMRLWSSATEYMDVHPTFLYESLWNALGLLLLVLLLAKRRRFDGQNTCFYFLWYGIGRFMIEGLRTDSLYLFNLQLFGEPVRVSQALSLVLAVTTAVILIYMLCVRRVDGSHLYVLQQAVSENMEEMQAEEALPSVEETADDQSEGTSS